MMEVEVKKSNHMFRLIPLILIVLLLFIRFPFLIAVSLKKIPISVTLANSIFLDGTYIFTAVLIWYERKELEKFNITLNSILIFTIIPLISLLMNVIIPQPETIIKYSLLDYSKPIIGIILLIALLISKIKIKRSSIKETFIWLVISIIVSIIVVLLVANYKLDTISLNITPLQLISLIIVQMNMAAISEEPLFRGFIWGYLVKFKWNIWLILVVQALLFMTGHIYYIGTHPIFVFLRTFIGGFIFGLIVWKSRSIATSMVTHSLVNSLGQILEKLY